MTLYRHYKNLPYKLIDIVRHSETLEDMVLYETLYENKGGRLWVRPKTMFFETINVEGKKQDRFAKIDIEVRTLNHFTDDARAAINRIGKLCFETWDPEDLDKRTAGKNKLHIALANYDNQVVAFKVGYELSEDSFYSWLGAVDPAYHRFGFASKLAEVQHHFCLSEGFTFIRTKCFNYNIPMLRLNLKLGFLVVDTEEHKAGLKLILEKRIRESVL